MSGNRHALGRLWMALALIIGCSPADTTVTVDAVVDAKSSDDDASVDTPDSDAGAPGSQAGCTLETLFDAPLAGSSPAPVTWTSEGAVQLAAEGLVLDATAAPARVLLPMGANLGPITLELTTQVTGGTLSVVASTGGLAPRTTSSPAGTVVCTHDFGPNPGAMVVALNSGRAVITQIAAAHCADIQTACTPDDCVSDDCTETRCHPLSGCRATEVVCDDGVDCTDDVCANGGCVHTPNAERCPNGGPCTQPPVCVPTSGCQTAPIDECCVTDADCDDGNPCTGTETCSDGQCLPGVPVDCSDGEPCNGLEGCHPTDGCVAAEPLQCNDDNMCNGIEFCVPGLGCSALPAPSCDDGNACTVETCDPATGCVYQGSLDCGDGDACNGVETCSPALGCKSGQPLECDDGKVCTGTESCDSILGCVPGTPPENCCVSHSDCDDADICNGQETCDGGVCLLGEALGCDDGNACNGQETCDPVLGCTAGAGLDCDDGNVCNGQETCDSTAGCLPGTQLVCDDGNFCNGAEQCDPTAGCISGPAPECDNGDLCDGLGYCYSPTGKCAATDALECDDGLPCNGMESCDSVVGCIVDLTDVPTGCCTVNDDCDDGNPCNGSSACNTDTGACEEVSPPLTCADSPCTVGVCAGPVGCVDVPTDDCDDGHICTADFCTEFGCVHKADPECCALEPCDKVGGPYSKGDTPVPEVPIGDRAFYVGGEGQQTILSAARLSDGSVLIGGVATPLPWAEELVTHIDADEVTGWVGGSGVGYIARLSPDLGQIISVIALPAGVTEGIRRIRVTAAGVFVSGATLVQKNTPTSGYFVAKFAGDFLTTPVTGFEWVVNQWADSAHRTVQPWDVDHEGRVTLVRGKPDGYDWTSVHRLSATGENAPVEHWRRHWGYNPEGDYVELPSDSVSALTASGHDVVHSGVILKPPGRCGLRSWTAADYAAEHGDGNGGTRTGTWPQDMYYSAECDGYAVSTAGPGYTGFQATKLTAIVGAIAVDPSTGDMYIGYSTRSKTPSGQTGREPAVVAYEADGTLKWWSRLQPETAGANTPQQWVDGLAVDKSTGTLIVGARSFGNNTVNFWAGNNVAAHPGASAYQNQFTGTSGNIHVSWLGRLSLQDGALQSATYLAEYGNSMAGTQGEHWDPNLAGWPDPNAGWPELNTTTLKAMSCDANGRVLIGAVGRRVVTTLDGYQSMPQLDEGESGWAHFARVYPSDFSTIRYSTILRGPWDTAMDGGGGNVEITAVLPTHEGMLVFGWSTSDDDGNAEGTPMPTTGIPSWGSTTPVGRDGVVAHWVIPQ